MVPPWLTSLGKPGYLHPDNFTPPAGFLFRGRFKFFIIPLTLSRTPRWPMADKEGVRMTGPIPVPGDTPTVGPRTTGQPCDMASGAVWDAELP